MRSKHLLALLLATAMLVTGAAITRAQPSPTTPKLPSPHEINPGIFDAQGCKVVPPGEEGAGTRLCGVKIPARMLLHLELGHYADLPGFEGPYFQAPGPNAEPGAVHLLTESITQSKEGLWQAWGLVRNQMNRSVGNVVVTASLFGQDGALLAKAPATVPIANLRPGEPGPFHVTTQVPAAKVKRAEFALQPGEAKPVSRDLLLMKYWELPYDRVEVKGVRRRDAVWRNGRRVYPYKLGTGFQNIGERPVPGANLLLAWLNDQDQVVWVEQTTMDPSFAGPISPKGFAHFRVIQVDDPKMGPRLYDLTPMYWVVGA